MGEEGNVIVTRNSRAFNESGALRPAPADAWPQRLSGSFLLSFFFYSLILQRCIFYFGPRPDGRDQMLVLPSFTGFFLLASSGRWLPSFTEFLRGFILFDYVDRELYLVLLGFTEFYRISSLAVTRCLFYLVLLGFSYWHHPGGGYRVLPSFSEVSSYLTTLIESST